MFDLKIEKYNEVGIRSFVLRSADDIESIYGFDPRGIEGYDELDDEDKEIYGAFIVRFYNSWGLDARSNIMPLNVEKRDESMKMKFRHYETENYLTIVNKNAWRQCAD